MRALLLLALPLALAGCVSPRAACLADATRETATIEGLIRQTEGNLRRGYAIEEEQVVRTVPDFCHYEDDEGRTRTRFCDRTEVRDVQRPVAIDLRAEQAKLDGLLERRAALASSQANRVAACQALPDTYSY